jgi:hypothetical protein
MLLLYKKLTSIIIDTNIWELLKGSRRTLRKPIQKWDCKAVYNGNIFVRNCDVTFHTILEFFRLLVFFSDYPESK